MGTLNIIGENGPERIVAGWNTGMVSHNLQQMYGYHWEVYYEPHHHGIVVRAFDIDGSYAEHTISSIVMMSYGGGPWELLEQVAQGVVNHLERAWHLT